MIHPYNSVYKDYVSNIIGSLLYASISSTSNSFEDTIKLISNSNLIKDVESNNISNFIYKSTKTISNSILDTFVFNINTNDTMYRIGYILSLFYYETNISFKLILDLFTSFELRALYSKYNQLSNEEIANKLVETYYKKQNSSNLKRLRILNNLTQLDLANLTNIPLRTIQQYEQKQKNINKASAEYILALSKALYCKSEELLEI